MRRWHWAAMAATIFSFGASFSTARAEPEFSHYKASSIYTGPHRRPDMSDKSAFQFRTRITDASRLPVNFAGEYVLSEWGCGTGCHTGVAVSAKTGRVIWLPNMTYAAGDPIDASKKTYDARPDSALLRAYGRDDEDKPLSEHFYLMTPQGLREIPGSAIVASQDSGNQPSSGNSDGDRPPDANKIFDVRAKPDPDKKVGAAVTLVDASCSEGEDAECVVGSLSCDTVGTFEIGYEGVSSKELANLLTREAEGQPQIGFGIDGQEFKGGLYRLDWGDLNSDWYATINPSDSTAAWDAIRKAKLAVIIKILSSTMKIPVSQLVSVTQICSGKPW